MNLDFIETMDLWYVPLAIFIVIGLLSVTIGFFNGWASASYFLIAEIVFFGIGLALYATLYSKFEDSIIKIIPESARKYIGEPKAFLDALRSSVGMIYMSLVQLLSLILIVPSYFIFRRWLKRSHYINVGMGKTKKARVSSRVGGACVGLVSGLFFAAPLTATAFATTVNSRYSSSNALYKFNNNIAKYVSFGIYDDPLSLQRTLGVVSLATDPKIKDLFQNFLDANKKLNKDDVKDLLRPENREKVQSVLNDPNLFNGIKSSVADMVNKQLNLPDGKLKVDTKQIEDIFKDPNGKFQKMKEAFANDKFHISTKMKSGIVDTLLDIHLQPKNPDNLSTMRNLLGQMIDCFATS